MTSRAFEISWRKSTPRQKYQPNALQFDGWIAQYELWNIEYDDPVVVDDSRIPIDKVEVQLQYERFQKHVKNYSKSTNTQASKKELALHFPTSISKGLNTITVLRTIFQRPQYVVPESLKLYSSANGWRRILMPIVHTTDSTLLLGPSERLRVGKTEDVREAVTFTQSTDMVLKFDRTPAFRIMTHEDYVLYQSVEGSEALTQDEDGAATIAVYQLGNAEGSDEPKLLGCIEGDGNHGSISYCVFHPTLPLLALHFRSTTGISQIILWCFARRTASNSGSLVLLSQSMLQKKESFSTSSVCTITSRLMYIRFAACGTYVIFETHAGRKQEIQMKALRAYDLAVEYQSMITASHSQPSPSHMNSENQTQDLKIASSLPNSISANHGSHSPSTAISFQPDASNRSIKLAHSSYGIEGGQTLLSLPAWDDIRNVSVSVRMPSRTREDKITIILNKTAQPFYTLSRAGGQTAPAVVRKDIRAIAKPKISGSLHSAKSQSSWQGISYTGDRDEDGETRVRKRARIDDSPGMTEGREGGQIARDKGPLVKKVNIELELEGGSGGNVEFDVRRGWEDFWRSRLADAKIKE
jgi:hypothetical protein